MIRKFRAPLLALLTFVLLAASQSSATAYFTRGSGNWSGVSTWSTVACGGAAAASVPAAGDTVTLCDGNAVTVDANTAVGSSPADDTGTPAVKAQSTTGTGVLNIAAGVTFTFRGPVRQGNGHWTVAAGAQLIHDSSVQGGTASYSWRVGEANCTSTCATLTMTGAAGNRITVGIAGGSAAFAGFSCNSTSSCVNGQGQIRAQYVNINRCGTSTAATNVCMGSYPYNSGDTFYCDHCAFTDSGVVQLWAARNNTTWQLNHSTIKTPVLAASSNNKCNSCSVQIFAVAGPGSTPTGVTYELKHSYVEGAVRFIGGTGLNGADAGVSFEDSVLMGNAGSTSGVDAPLNTGASFPGAHSWSNMLLYSRVTSNAVNAEGPEGTLTRTIVLFAGNIGNMHFWSHKGSQSQATLIDGVIGERLYDDASAGASDFINPISRFGSGARPLIALKHVLLLPTPGGQPLGSLVNDSTVANCNGTTVICPQITVEHNTWRGDDLGGLLSGAGGENNAGYAGLYASLSNNLVWRAASGAGWLTRWGGSVTLVAGTYTAADYNGYCNITGIRYFQSDSNPAAYTAAPGTHDVSACPNFVDATRNFLNWGKSIDPTVTTWANILAIFARMNDDTGSNPNATVANAYDWIRAGWAPRNTALRGAGSDGQDLGAVPVSSSTRHASVTWR